MIKNRLPAIIQYYYAWDLSHRKTSSDASKFTTVLSEAQVDLNPHQVEAALFAFKSPLSKGAILADEVGLGKTIEAGIILSQFWAEMKRNIIIIVPASLRSQWRNELLEKFYLPSTVLVGKEDIEPSQDNIRICSYNFAHKYSEELSKIRWDLVVFDEAHKLRNVYKKTTLMANKIRKTFQPFKKILLTATPLQNNLKELYGLISVIDDRYFSSIETFNSQYNQISTRDKAKFGELKGRLTNIIKRTLRNQVQEYVNYTRRTSFVQEFEWSEEEEQLYNSMNDFLQREFLFSIPDKQKPLLDLIIRKIMASSSYALSFTLDKIVKRLREKSTLDLNELLSDYEIFEEDKIDDDDLVYGPRKSSNEALEEEIQELENYRDMAASIKNESKAKSLLTALDICFGKMHQMGIDKKALIFTESRRTQEYLSSFLSENGYNGKVIKFNGTNNDSEAKIIYKLWKENPDNWDKITGNSLLDRKEALVENFRHHSQIMLATEAGAEGINLQFCSLVVNYDLPWNPQRIEQRIGRCHRYGQKNDVIVVNFVNRDNYADYRVYELLNDKLNLFDGVFGCSDEILGSLESGIDIERRLAEIYQNCRTQQEIEAAFDQLQKDLEDIINDRIKQTKKHLLENFDQEVIQKLKLREREDNRFIDTYHSHFWKLTKSILSEYIEMINDNNLSFLLRKDLGNEIPSGNYIINKNFGEYHQLRLNTPLGQLIIAKSYDDTIDDTEIIFNLSQNEFKVNALDKYKNQSGIMVIYRVTSENNFEDSETLIPICLTDNYDVLPPELAYKIMDLRISDYHKKEDLEISESIISDNLNQQVDKYREKIDELTAQYINYEIDKLQAWMQDNIEPLNRELVSLEHQKKAVKSQLNKERNPKEKLRLQEEFNSLDRKKRSKLKEFYALSDEYDEINDKTINELKKKASNTFRTEFIGRFRWKVI